MSEPVRAPAHNIPEFTVGEISQALRRSVEERFGHIRVRGEISGFKRHSSGHLYFCLKDTDAVLDAVCWRGQALRIAVKPEDGLEVICTGRLTTYPGRSKYQMVVEAVELAGEGALLKLLEERKRRLAAEGLFDTARKKPLPFLPEVIGVITSPTGAVIRDILHRLAERFPRRVLLWPVAVQGEGAAEQVAAAIRGFNALPPGGPVPRPDLLIVARGGGSLEDLWAFNEEVVVRAAADSAIPLISAVGHETDTTLIDYAADLRAPTPTAAAEKAVPVRLELIARVLDCGTRQVNGMGRLLEERRLRLENLHRRLPNLGRVLEDLGQRLDDRMERLANAMPNLLRRRRERLEQAEPLLRHGLRALLQHKRHYFALLAGRLRDRPLRDEIARGERTVADLAGRLRPAMARLLAERGGRLDHCGALLESYSYERVLERGYAVVHDASGRPVTSAASARTGALWTVEFRDDKVDVLVGARPKPRRPRGGDDERQEQLL